jgi:hypothetical protein
VQGIPATREDNKIAVATKDKEAIELTSCSLPHFLEMECSQHHHHHPLPKIVQE